MKGGWHCPREIWKVGGSRVGDGWDGECSTCVCV